MITLTPELLINMLNQDQTTDPVQDDAIDEWLEKFPASPAIKLLVAKQQLRQTGQIDSQLWQQLLLEWQPVSQLLIWENNGGSFIDRDETPDKVDLLVQQLSFDQTEVLVGEQVEEKYTPVFPDFIWSNQEVVATLEPDFDDKLLTEILPDTGILSDTGISKEQPLTWELPNLPFFVWTDQNIISTWVEKEKLLTIFEVGDHIDHISFIFDMSSSEVKATYKEKKEKSKKKADESVYHDKAERPASNTIDHMEHKEPPNEKRQTEEVDAQASDFIKWLKKLPGAAEHQDSIIDLQEQRKKEKKKKKSEKENKIKLKGLKKKDKEKKKKKKGKKGELEKIIQSSVEKKDDLVSETLAMILAKQEHYSKSIEMYEKLILINPEKSSYFAARIRELKKNI